MKTVIVVGGLMLAAGFIGQRIGEGFQLQADRARIHSLEKQVERFQNPTVFHNAVKLARITHTPLYQVLTGQLDPAVEE